MRGWGNMPVVTIAHIRCTLSAAPVKVGAMLSAALALPTATAAPVPAGDAEEVHGCTP